MHRTRTLTLTAATAVTALTLAACGGGSDNPLDSSGDASGAAPASSAPKGTISVGAANFPESQLLADLYAAALNAHGIKATTGDPIGAREVYLKALKDGSIDLVPEYIYSLLTYYDKNANAKDPKEIYAALKKQIPDSQVLLDMAAAQDANSIAVTQKTAQEWDLTSIGDLAEHSDGLQIAAPPEFKGRQQGMKGLASVYGVKATLRPLTGKAVALALKNGQVKAANIFSTDPAIQMNDFVVLEDPKHLFGSDNVVPLMRKDKATPKVTKVINAVQAELTTDNLTAMNKKVQVDHMSAAKVAKQFLKEHGLN